MRDLRGFTLIRPWTWTMIHAPKEVRKGIENRPLKLPLKFVDVWILFHSGRGTEDKETVAFIERTLGLRLPRSAWDEGIIGRVKFSGMIRKGASDLFPDDVPPPGQEPWFFGPYGYVVSEAEALSKPIPCKGMLGFWRVPPHVLAQLPESWR
jgi:hypothetical protein